MKRDLRIVPLLHFLLPSTDLILLPAQRLEGRCCNQFREIICAFGGGRFRPPIPYPGSQF